MMRSVLDLFKKILFIVVSGVYLTGCNISKTEDTKLIISESQFSIRQDGEHSYVLDAEGKVKNIGTVDAKDIVITGYCKSCGAVLTPDAWMVSPDVEKLPEQKSFIPDLAVGEEKFFAFKGVAFIYIKKLRQPKIPHSVKVVIESSKVAD